LEIESQQQHVVQKQQMSLQKMSPNWHIERERER
jgi:hypothetical protein